MVENRLDHKTRNLLIELKHKILNKYELIEMRLFGSLARGDKHVHSDIDIFVRILNVDRAIEEGIFDLAYEVELKYNCIIDIFVFDDKKLNEKYMWAPVYQNILQEGIVV